MQSERQVIGLVTPQGRTVQAPYHQLLLLALLVVVHAALTPCMIIVIRPLCQNELCAIWTIPLDTQVWTLELLMAAW